jgi:hypothetical protein
LKEVAMPDQPLSPAAPPEARNAPITAADDALAARLAHETANDDGGQEDS